MDAPNEKHFNETVKSERKRRSREPSNDVIYYRFIDNNLMYNCRLVIATRRHVYYTL